MKLGDLVRLRTGYHREDGTGVIIDNDPTGWWWVLGTWDDYLILWPPEQLEVISEDD